MFTCPSFWSNFLWHLNATQFFLWAITLTAAFFIGDAPQANTPRPRAGRAGVKVWASMGLLMAAVLHALLAAGMECSGLRKV
jgi:hypothetical protein